MVINKIKVSDNFTHFIEAFKYEGDRRQIRLDEYRLESIYTQIVETCFQRYIGEDFGDIIEYIGNSITMSDDMGDVENDHDAYMLVYENADIIEDIYTRLKYNGNSLFRGDGYGENISVSLEFIDNEAYIVFNTTIALFNAPIFTQIDGSVEDKPDMVIELETEFLVFKNMFTTYLIDHFSHNTGDLMDNDYITLFAGLVELSIMYDDSITNIDDIVDSLNQIFGEVVEAIDPHDTETYGRFYLKHTEYINRLHTYIQHKCRGGYDIMSWGVLGEKVLIGLKRRY